MQPSTWILVTNTNKCRLYSYHGNSSPLKLLKEISHPENKEGNGLDSGRYLGNDKGHGTYSPASFPKDIKIDDFSKEIDKVLDHGRNTQAYSKLVVITPPHMNGLLLQHLNKHVKELVTHNIHKDVMHLTEPELLAFVHEHTRYPDE